MKWVIGFSATTLSMVTIGSYMVYKFIENIDHYEWEEEEW